MSKKDLYTIIIPCHNDCTSAEKLAEEYKKDVPIKNIIGKDISV